MNRHRSSRKVKSVPSSRRSTTTPHTSSRSSISHISLPTHTTTKTSHTYESTQSTSTYTHTHTRRTALSTSRSRHSQGIAQKRNTVARFSSSPSMPSSFKREDLEDLLVRKFFVAPSYEIYGGIAGLFDYGPPGCAIMANLQNQWRKHFVLTEQMLEVSCSTLTPEPVLKASGHADRFTDYMVQDTKSNEYFRADKLVEDHIEKLLIKNKGKDIEYLRQLESDYNAAGSMSKEQLENTLDKYKITVNGNPVSPVTQFNLMFKTSIGPTGKVGGYLRPETAQGIFVNFRRLYEFNNRRLPFAGAQIGLAYRNEIAPRGGLLRVREFPMAEIEHFVHPERKQHPKFNDVSHLKAQFWTAESQQGDQQPIPSTFGEMVSTKQIDNETLGYFLGRTLQFLTDVGVDPARIRFRQHRSTEMAHYAQDCWDAEILTSYGWVECVGHADRSAYDLKVHSDATKQDLCVGEPLETPIIETKFVPKLNRGVLGKTLRGQAVEVFNHFETASQKQLEQYKNEMETQQEIKLSLSDGNSVTLTPKEITIDQILEKRSVETFTPHVIEPSFGLGRIIYSLLEHAYYVRNGDDEQRKVLKLSPIIAPFKVGLYNVVSNIPYHDHLTRLKNDAIELGLAYQEDTSKSSIGRKYSRGDEIGTPYAISIDSDTLTNNRVTIRERDSMQQIQVSIDDAMNIIHTMIRGRESWDGLVSKYSLFTPGSV